MRKLLDAKELTALISARHFRALRDALAGKKRSRYCAVFKQAFAGAGCARLPHTAQR